MIVLRIFLRPRTSNSTGKYVEYPARSRRLLAAVLRWQDSRRQRACGATESFRWRGKCIPWLRLLVAWDRLWKRQRLLFFCFQRRDCCCEAAVNLTASRLPKDSKALVASAKCLPDYVYVDYVYARFVLHALTEEEQHDLFVWMQTHVKKKIFIETRSVNDPRCGKGKKVGNHAYVDTHYRRFMSCVDLQAAASEAGLLVDDVKDTTPGSGNDGARVVRATLSIAWLSPMRWCQL